MGFSRGDRVYLCDWEPMTLGTTPRSRLATMKEPGDEAHTSNGTPRSVTCLVTVADAYGGNSTEQAIAEDLLDLAGSLGDRYEQVVGPFSDFVTMWTQAVKLAQRGGRRRAIDIIGVHWPEWFLIVEIRGGGVEVPIVRDRLEWRWHMALLPTDA